MAIIGLNIDRARLLAAKVPFTEEYFFSGFHGTRIIFADRYAMKQAAEALDINKWDIPRYFKQYALQYF